MWVGTLILPFHVWLGWQVRIHTTLDISIFADDLTAWNTQTWGWEGCSNLQLGNICLSTGSPPMPAPVTDAVCGPLFRGPARLRPVSTSPR
jgi:hypothetical protein